MTDMSKPESRSIALASGLVADVLVKGEGAPLLFFHAAQGRNWTPFLDGLAEQYAVHAPLTPGADEPDELLNFDGFSDLAIYYDDLCRALGIDTAVVVGHAFGAMAAAEFAAHCPDRVSALVLIGAKGLWIDDIPVADVHTTHPSGLAALLFNEPEGPAAKTVLSKPTPEDRLDYQLVLGASSHFYWPVPDRDLKRRLYRITAPTLLLWGSDDRVVPPVYADRFAKGIADSTKLIVPGGSHFVHLEKTEESLSGIRRFLDEKLTLTEAVQ